MPSRRASVRPRSGHGLAMLAGLVVTVATTGVFSVAYQAPMGSGLNQKQQHGNIRNKDKLEGVYELPPDPVEAPEEEKPAMPERRVPYTLHIVTQLPQHKHLHEESNAKHYIEEKVVSAMEKFEDFIKHVEVNLQVSEHFHREKRPEKGKKGGELVETEEEDIAVSKESNPGHKILTPYIFKATVTLANHHKVTLSNPEKHAQATLQEAVDHMVDVLKKSLRDEKNRMIHAHRKQADALPEEEMEDLQELNKELADGIMEEKAGADDEAEEAMYQRIEAKK